MQPAAMMAGQALQEQDYRRDIVSAAMMAAEETPNGRGKGHSWTTTTEELASEDLFTKAVLAAQGLRLGAIRTKVKNIVCAHSTLGCQYK